MSSISNVNSDNSTCQAKDSRNLSLSKSVTVPHAFSYFPPLIHAPPFIPHQPIDPHAGLVIIQPAGLAQDPDCANEADKQPVKTEDIVDDTDPSVNLHSFFLDQLRESKDRMYLLRLEDQFINLIQDSPHSLHYQHITSYHRMLIHRMATYFGLDHTLDDDGTGVNVTKTAKSRIPETRFCDLIPAPQEGEQGEKEPVTILRRKDPSVEQQPIQPNPQIIRPVSPPSSDSETKSIKEREETYAMVRARIFEGEGTEGELVPIPILIPSEETVPQSDHDPPAHSSSSHDARTLIEAPSTSPIPPSVSTSSLKDEPEVIPGSNTNNKSNTGNSNSRRRNHDNNRHVRNKNSFPNPTQTQVQFSPQLVVPSNLPYVQLGSFCTPQQNEPRLPVYPIPRNPPLSSHNGLSSFPIPPNLSLLPTQQHFLPQAQHAMRQDATPFLPNPHLPSVSPHPQSAMQVPINPASNLNQSFAHYQAMMNMGMQTPSASLLQRAANPSYQGMPPVSDVMNFLPQAPPAYETGKEDGYVLMPGYQQMGTPPYPGMQWEQSGPGVLKLKHPASALSSQLQMPQSIQQLANNMDMMGIQSGEEQMYLHSNQKHLPPEMYPNYVPHPNQVNPNASMPGQGMYVPNNFAAVLPYQYPSQEGAIHPPINPPPISMPNSRFVITHPTSVANCPMPIPEPGFPPMMTQRPVHNLVPNPSAHSHSHTNGQQHPFAPLNQMNAQMIPVQQPILPTPHSVNNQATQDFQMNSQNIKNIKHSNSPETSSFNQENNRSKPNRHSNSRPSNEKSRHRSQQQNAYSEKHKSGGSIYIPPRAAAESRSQGEKDGLLPTPASMRILEIFDLKISFEEAEKCIREISPVNVTFHCLKPAPSGQEVLFGIFESEEVTAILNKINSNPNVEFRTRFPDQTLVKYLSSTILQHTASN